MQYWADMGPSRLIESWRLLMTRWNFVRICGLRILQKAAFVQEPAPLGLLAAVMGAALPQQLFPACHRKQPDTVWNPKQLNTLHPVLRGQTQVCLSDASWLAHLPHSHLVPSVCGRSFFGGTGPMKTPVCSDAMVRKSSGSSGVNLGFPPWSGT